MDDSSKIAVGIVAAAALLLVGFIGYREFERQRDIDEAQQVLQTIAQTGQQVTAQYQAGLQQVTAQTREQEQLQWVRQERLREYEFSRRALASDQRCVGGVVIQVTGSTYTQLGSISSPIHCSDGYADQPLR
jgi:preprotein translocase subunit SecF